MTLNKPKNVWHWLGLLSPGAVSVVMTAFGKLLPEADQVAPGMLGFPVAFVLCIVITVLLVRGPDKPGGRFGLGLLIMLGLVIVNFSIGFGGCAVIQPHFDMR
jgi:hypothetical protein